MPYGGSSPTGGSAVADDDARHGRSTWPRGIGGALSAFAIEVAIVVVLVGGAFVFAALALMVF